MFTEEIKRALGTLSHARGPSEIMDYAVLPAGKLFRPRLVEALFLDLTGNLSQNGIHLGVAIELHHAYSLVHDDLPAMDNDMIRRGKPSTHAAYGEWKAILTGDALLIGSFHELMKIKHPDIYALHHLLSWSAGAKGLILGQYLDLEADGKLSISEVIRVHELKTARLIQMATLGTHLLTRKNKDLKDTIGFFRLGREIGVTFQLLDDLGELTDQTLSEHEKMINPFIVSPHEAIKALATSHKRLKQLIIQHKLGNLDKMMKSYFKEGQSKLELNFQKVRTHLDRQALPEIEKWITTFV